MVLKISISGERHKEATKDLEGLQRVSKVITLEPPQLYAGVDVSIFSKVTFLKHPSLHIYLFTL